MWLCVTGRNRSRPIPRRRLSWIIVNINSTILAYGELKTGRKVEQYEKFTIDIKYRDTERKPKYIVIVATSSKYGDYFSGSTSSVLLIDEFELGFD